MIYPDGTRVEGIFVDCPLEARRLGVQPGEFVDHETVDAADNSDSEESECDSCEE